MLPANGGAAGPHRQEGLVTGSWERARGDGRRAETGQANVKNAVSRVKNRRGSGAPYLISLEKESPWKR